MTREVKFKDTNTFSFTPKYKYPNSINRRYTFVWGEAKSYIETIRYAVSLITPNKICVVYLVGDITQSEIEQYLSDIGLSDSKNIMVVFSECAGKHIERCAWVDGVFENARQKFGVVTMNTINTAREEIKRFEKHGIIDDEELYSLYSDILAAYDNRMEYRERFRRTWDRTIKSVGAYTGKLDGDDKVHFEELKKIARRVYPYGIECANLDVQAYNMTRRVELACDAINGVSRFGVDVNNLDKPISEIIYMYMDEDYDPNSLHNNLPVSIYYSKEEAAEHADLNVNAVWRCITGRTESVKFGEYDRVGFESVYLPEDIPYRIIGDIRKYIKETILNTGMVLIPELKERFAKPPYGFYDCNWYSYILAVAIRDVCNGRYMCRTGALPFVLDNESVISVFQYMEYVNRVDDCAVIYRQNQEQIRTATVFKRVFRDKDVSADLYAAIVRVRQKLQNKFCVGCIDMFSHEIYEFLNSEDKYFCMHYGYERLYRYLVDNRVRLREIFDNLDKFAVDYLKGIYPPENVDEYVAHVRSSRHGGSIKSWLWTKEKMLNECERFIDGLKGANNHDC